MSSKTTGDNTVLVQSRETGDVVAGIENGQQQQGQVKALPFAKSWIHLIAGGYVCGARQPRLATCLEEEAPLEG